MEEIIKNIEANIVTGENNNKMLSVNHRSNEIYRELVKNTNNKEELEDAMKIILNDVSFIAKFAYSDINQDILDIFSESELDELAKLRQDVGRLYKKLLKKFKSMYTRHSDRVAKAENKLVEAKPVKEVKPKVEPVKETGSTNNEVEEFEKAAEILVKALHMPEIQNNGETHAKGMRIRTRNYKFLGFKAKSSDGADTTYNAVMNRMILNWLENNEVKYKKKTRIKKMYYNDLIQTDLLLEPKIFKRLNSLAVRNKLPVAIVANYILDDIRHQYEANR